MDLNQVTLPVRDMPESVAFYLTLGFTQIVDTPHYARFSCPQGQSTFSLSLQERTSGSGVVIYFECEQLDKHCAMLQDRGIIFEQLPTDMSYLWREAVLYDPSGNQIKLYHAGQHRLNPPWAVNICLHPPCATLQKTPAGAPRKPLV